MKITSLRNMFRILGPVAACFALTVGVADAKPDKDKGGKGGKGGAPGHSEKGNKGKPGKKGGDEHKDVRKDVEKAQKEARKADDKQEKEAAEWRKKGFRDADRDGVLRYFADHKDSESGLPPGLAKNLRRGKPLPPGWQKKVVNGYVIEDDYRDHFIPVEYGLFPGLEVVPDTRLYWMGDRLVRVYEPRNEIIDLIIVPTIRLLAD